MSDSLEIHLKSAPDTFTDADEPSELSDVNVQDLVNDIENNGKNINNLHVIQAIAILLHTLQDIIKLQQNPEAFETFRRSQLAKRNINLDIADRPEIALKMDRRDASTSTSSSVDSESPPNSPPAKILKTEDSISSFSTLRNTTPDALDEHNEGSETPNSVVSVSELVASTDLEKSYALDLDDITKEFAYHCDGKIITQKTHLLKCFNLVNIPALSIQQFLARINTYSSSISVACYIHAAFMLYKLCVLHNAIPLTLYNVHRLILAAIRCASKKLEDLIQKQKSFATVGGVSQKELFKIEVGFLFLCNFRVMVGQDSLNAYLKDFAELQNFCKEQLDGDDGPMSS